MEYVSAVAGDAAIQNMNTVAKKLSVTNRLIFLP